MTDMMRWMFKCRGSQWLDTLALARLRESAVLELRAPLKIKEEHPCQAIKIWGHALLVV